MKRGLTKEDAKQVALANVWRWREDVDGKSFLDDAPIASSAVAEDVVRDAPERALEHG